MLEWPTPHRSVVWVAATDGPGFGIIPRASPPTAGPALEDEMVGTRNPSEQLEVLMRGTRFADEAEEDWTDTTLETGSLRAQMRRELGEKLATGRPLRVYLGVDPTSTELHVGHFVPLQKLRQFQELGHQAVFLIGDYTATIGDPSGRDTERTRLTHEQVLELAVDYTQQAFQVLDPEHTEIRYNGEWLAKLSFADLIELASVFPMKQIVARRDFQKRMERGESLRFHEALYALMQGYDAYALKCDVQVGAYDQYFNMLAGRTIQEHFGEAPHVMITSPLIVGTDGRKMSKSYGNTINVRDEPFDMYGKTMRIADAHLREYLELTSSLPTEKLDALIADLNAGGNPMAIKQELAHNLVEQYHGAAAAVAAAEEFRTVVQQRQAPDEVPVTEVPDNLAGATWVDLCSGLDLVSSKGELRRLMQQGGFYVDQEPVRDTAATAELGADGVLLRFGKRRYHRLVPEGAGGASA